MIALLFWTALQVGAAPLTDAQLYVVGPTDVLVVSVYNQPQLSGKFVVEADGTFAYPLLGRVAGGGLSVRALEDKIRAALAAGYLKEPQVSVSVEQYRSQQIFVMGEVKQPGSVPFTGSMTLIEAIVRAGSTTDRAGAEVVIVRPGTGAQATAPAQNPNAPNAETMKVDLQRLQTGTLSQNVALRPGDTIFVPRAETVFVSGQVQRPGEYAIRKGMTVRHVLALAGGVTDRGSTRRIQIIRVVNGKEVATGVDQQRLVQAGDTIVVLERFF